MLATELKELRSFRRGRIKAKTEVRTLLRMRQRYERLIYANMNHVFKQHINALSYTFEQTGDFNSLIASRAMYIDMAPTMTAFLRRVFINTYKFYDEMYEGGKKNAQEAIVFGRVVDIEALVNDYFRNRELTLSNIPANLARRIDRLIRDGRADNLTLAQISKNIRDKILPISRSRAAMIARTETHNAGSFAAHGYHNQVRRDLGINMYKQWVSTNDSRTRSHHSEANGQRVHMDEKFNVGGTEMDFAGDPAGGAKNVINCRCVIIYADERDIVIP